MEECADGDPLEVAQENARRKARAVEGELVVGVDTVVALDERILPKPRDAAQAREWLRSLSGAPIASWAACAWFAPGASRSSPRSPK